MKVLFIGGTGTISSACSELFIKQGIELFLLNRGKADKSLPAGARHLQGDINDTGKIQGLLRNEHFDAVVDWIAFTPEQTERDYELFHGKTDQYIFISSASVYAKIPPVPITEEWPAENPYWEYSRQKILCEQFLLKQQRENDFPVTIVRPSHTYDEFKLPLHGGYTALNRILTGKKIIIHGDGTTHWTLTCNSDFAAGFIGLIGKSQTIGEIYHITTDRFLTWNEICENLAASAGVEPNIIHIPSDVIARYDKDWGDGLFGDKAYNLIFDNSKVKSLAPGFQAKIPYSEGAAMQVEFYRTHPEHCVVNRQLDELMDKMVRDFEKI